jgi:salicylate hydroxylase
MKRPVTVFADRDHVEARALICADGRHSLVFGRCLMMVPPRVSGHTTYRTVISTEKMPEDLRWNVMNIWVGSKCHIGHYPLKGGKVFNLVVTYHRNYPEAVSGLPVARDKVRVGLESLIPQALQIIDRSENWKMWVLCDRDPVRNWVDAMVTLLGDAAHPTLSGPERVYGDGGRGQSLASAADFR